MRLLISIVSFVAIHPFTDRNGTSGRLFHILAARSFGRDHGRGLTPTIFDNDVMTTREQFQSDQNLGFLLREWISYAEHDDDFVFRCQSAL